MERFKRKIIKIIKNFTFSELVKGLVLTFRYFCKKKITLHYPEEEVPRSFRFRGMLALRRYANGEERCIACKLCEAVCPALAITIESAPRIGDGSRKTTVYNVDIFKCIYCGFCEESCPVDAIVLTTEMHYSIKNRGENILTKEKLLMIGDIYEKEITRNLKRDQKYK
ncbi:NADH-quinone oxidoreductase subunit NuoI [Coxiella endosymbiont of Amblyomma sculptum]|uniref:NADH-quinone oxidoreductase subunit NuoI n=1 Tax=Coxiella endosymbiont of Amblyomma sculptum TaxID=2487929 RepID=UPI00132E9734|nr:NADH-quinone oxidoreductase subunit NuoI [Coxiella endosymbiont of Amblyomma sculptum]QHG92317.1 NADH-quinone oxidoreductase subunit NuoI [Coxiella endosymbiont of Amblyomma sculptum]